MTEQSGFGQRECANVGKRCERQQDSLCGIGRGVADNLRALLTHIHASGLVLAITIDLLADSWAPEVNWTLDGQDKLVLRRRCLFFRKVC